MDELARESDVLVLCCQLDETTRHIANAELFKKVCHFVSSMLLMMKTRCTQMKKTAVLINVGRGGLVDSLALLDALKAEQIYAAGLDVLEDEWQPGAARFQELVDHPRCVCACTFLVLKPRLR